MARHTAKSHKIRKVEILVIQILIGENEWVEGWKWYDAISARKNGTATQEQIELLDKGHWKE